MRPDPDPVNELYDRGCDLVEAATAIRELAAADSGALCAPALLGCLETALEHLSEATAALDAAVHEAVRDATGDPVETARTRMRQGFANLHRGLVDARTLASAARALSSRVLARSGVTAARLSA